MTHNTGLTRKYIAAILGIIGILTILAGTLLGYCTRTLFNADAFADRAAQSLKDEGVARLVATRIADRLIEHRRDLIAFRPLIIGTTQSLVSSSPFRAMIRRAVRVSHQTFLSETGKNLSLTVVDAGVILRSAFGANPELANKIPSKLTTVLASLNEAPGGNRLTKLLVLAHRLRIGSISLLILGIVMTAISILMAHEKRNALFRAGFSLALSAVILVLIVQFGGSAIALYPKDPLIGDAVVGFWKMFLGGFMLWALILGFVGLVLCAAVTSLLEKVQLDEIAASVREWFRHSAESTPKRLLAIFILLCTGTFLVLFPSASMTFICLLAGMSLFFVGLREFFSLVLRSLPQLRQTAKTELSKRRLLPARAIFIASLAVIIIGLSIYFLFPTENVLSASNKIETCNGYEELCDRRLNEVVFPAAHNAMSAAEISGWMFPNHEKGIQVQLQDGIRAFLMDTHYGAPVGDKVKTLLENEQAARKKYEAALGKEGVEAAMRIRDRLIGIEEGKTEIYLCHGFCELGATPLMPVLHAMRDFLISNPNEVVIIINQDEGVTPQSMESAFRESGLIDFVYRGQVRPPWPTLREMINNDQRILVFAENNNKGVEWYHPVLESVQETPYSFHDPKEFTCIPNRGGVSGSLFLMNHWIDSTPAPKPSNAQIVNSYDFLLNRAHQCQKQRQLTPNLIAVDFYKTGNLFEVVETLNGIKKNI